MNLVLSFSKVYEEIADKHSREKKNGVVKDENWRISFRNGYRQSGI
jgi:hypothetical protein